MSPSCCWRWTSPGADGILIVAGGCAALTVLSYAITHGHDPDERTLPARPDQPGGDRASPPLSPRATRARSRRCASMRACSTSRTTRSSCATTTTSSPTGTARRPSSTAGGRSRRSAARQPSSCRHEFPAPFDDDHGRARSAPDAGRANWCTPRATAGVSSWPAAGRCSATAAAGRRRILETNNDITEQRAGRGRPAPRPQASLPMSRASPPWASSRPRSPTRSTSRWPPSSPTARPACAGWRATSPTSARRAARSST